MRSYVMFALVCALLAGASAQQKNPPKERVQKTPQTTPAEQPTKPAEPATKPPEPARPAATPAQPAEGEEHFDMTEVPPVVTHHQVTLAGRTLRYPATTGRLPVKTADGRLEGVGFFVAC